MLGCNRPPQAHGTAQPVSPSSTALEHATCWAEETSRVDAKSPRDCATRALIYLKDSHTPIGASRNGLREQISPNPASSALRLQHPSEMGPSTRRLSQSLSTDCSEPMPASASVSGPRSHWLDDKGRRQDAKKSLVQKFSLFVPCSFRDS